MGPLTITGGQPEQAIAIMREVAAWGRSQGFRVWPDEWLTAEALLTEEAQPENFYVGTVDGKLACAFILQWRDREYWPDAPPGEAAYLHKLCVRREFAHQSMARRVVELIRAECTRRGARFIRLDTGANEPTVRDIYLRSGFEIVKTIERNGRPVMLLYELNSAT